MVIFKIAIMLFLWRTTELDFFVQKVYNCKFLIFSTKPPYLAARVSLG